jgi:hypothetical protein
LVGSNLLLVSASAWAALLGVHVPSKAHKPTATLTAAMMPSAANPAAAAAFAAVAGVGGCGDGGGVSLLQGRRYRYSGKHWLTPMLEFVSKALVCY